MSRYIEADAVITAIAEFNKYEDELEYPYASDDLEEYKDDARLLIEDAPSIDIVRCKECKYCNEWEHPNGIELYCNNPNVDPFDWGGSISFYVKADDYCSYGERESE